MRWDPLSAAACAEGRRLIETAGAARGAPPDAVRAAQAAFGVWAGDDAHAGWGALLAALVASGDGALLWDCFRRVLPFGTGGRRGAVGPGPNRFQAEAAAATARGHLRHLRAAGVEAPVVVVGGDTRRFLDLRATFPPGVPHPAHGASSQDFARAAAEAYAAGGATVYLAEHAVATPLLAFAVRAARAHGGLCISASHNPPDDNGAKVFTATGGQPVAPEDAALLAAMQDATPDARAGGCILPWPASWPADYAAEVCSAVGAAPVAGIRVVYTALHGAGGGSVGRVLSAAGVDWAPEPAGAQPDGAFPSVPRRSPNPEHPEALARACAHADAIGASLVLGTDPDADRLGAATRGPKGWVRLDGNDIAALAADAWFAPGSGPGLFLTTVASGRLAARVAAARGAVVQDQLPVGFKHIGAALDAEPPGPGVRVLGAEESHGLAVGPWLRDKDAAGGALLLVAAAARVQAAGSSLAARLDALHAEHGAVGHVLRSLAVGPAALDALSAALRRWVQAPPPAWDGRRVHAVVDHADPSGPRGPLRGPTDAAARDMITVALDGDARVLLRPSGTEPRVKIYAECLFPAGSGVDAAEARGAAHRLAAAAVAALAEALGWVLPPWAHALSDHLALEDKAVFAREIVPAVLAGPGGAAPAADAAVAALAGGDRSLIAPGVAAFLDRAAPLDAARLRAWWGAADDPPTAP